VVVAAAVCLDFHFNVLLRHGTASGKRKGDIERISSILIHLDLSHQWFALFKLD